MGRWRTHHQRRAYTGGERRRGMAIVFLLSDLHIFWICNWVTSFWIVNLVRIWIVCISKLHGIAEWKHPAKNIYGEKVWRVFSIKRIFLVVYNIFGEASPQKGTIWVGRSWWWTDLRPILWLFLKIISLVRFYDYSLFIPIFSKTVEK